MLDEFIRNGIKISYVYHCPHHPSISSVCDCRKPNPGMLLDAQKDFDIDLSSSIVIGDKERDVEAGLNAGLRESYLFDESKKTMNSKATKIVSNLSEIWK